MGKTAFALGLALNAALQQGKTVAIFSLEMSYEELARRLFCAVAKVNGRALQNGLFGVQLLDRAVEASAGLLEAPIFIDDQGGANLLEIKAKLRRLQKKRGLDLVIIDYLQLLRGVGRAESRVQEISQISCQLKELAKEFQVPILALSQLSRSLESRADKRSMLSDLRESGSIEQDADIVLFLFRPDYYAKGGQTYGNLAELSVAKNRNGPVGGERTMRSSELGIGLPSVGRTVALTFVLARGKIAVSYYLTSSGGDLARAKIAGMYGRETRRDQLDKRPKAPKRR